MALRACLPALVDGRWPRASRTPRTSSSSAGGRHLRHPDVLGNRLVATAYSYGDSDPDSAIQRSGAIVLFDTRGARPVRDLTSGGADSSPIFSPDGRRVAFERRRSVFTVPVAGGTARRLLRSAREPSWSR